MPKTPSSWKHTTFWTRKISLFAALLICSLGLCGANYAAFGAFSSSRSSGSILMVTGLIELAGMLVGVLGLFASVIGFVAASFSGKSDSTESTIDLHLRDREDDR